jgi:two-component system sensor kinase FixL
MPDTRNRVSAESALWEAEAQLAFAAETTALGLFEWDLVTGALTWSYGDEASLGLAPGSIVSFESWSQRVFPEDVSATQTLIAKVAAQKLDKFTFRYRIRRDDGKARTIEGAARCIYDAGGTLVKTTGVNVDVTERVEREAALRDREAQLGAIMATMPSAMVVIDVDGAIHMFSAAAERLFGYAAADLLGQNLALLVPNSARESLSAQFASYRAARVSGDAGELFELVARCNGGAEIPVEFSIAEMIVAGEPRYTVFIRDLSERAAAEQAAADLRNELAQVGRGAAMGELAASLAHELNQPLSATANFLAATVLLVSRGGDRDKVAELVTLANDQIQRAGSIIRNIREFIVKRDVEIGIEPIEKTVRDAVSLVLVGSARVDVEVRYAFEQPGQFMLADRVQIQQVLVNLLRNAAEALQDQPKHRRTILIAVRGKPGDMIEISVSDTGAGIDARILETLFTPLSSTKGSEGMGLGLSICRRIIEAHGGTLSAENRSAGGATFRFTLPAGSFEMPDDDR